MKPVVRNSPEIKPDDYPDHQSESFDEPVAVLTEAESESPDQGCLRRAGWRERCR